MKTTQKTNRKRNSSPVAIRKTLAVGIIPSLLMISLSSCSPTDPNAKYFTYEVNGESDIYAYNDYKGLTVTGYTADNEEIRVPAYIDGQPVTVIGMNAFSDVKAESVILPKGIEAIFPDAFGDNLTIKSVLLPSTLQTMYNAAFERCTALTEITVPENVTELSLGLFCECDSLFRAELPEGLTKIGAQTFMNCVSLEEAIIPSSVTEICDNAYRGCTSLKKVTLPEGLLSIGGMCFDGCGELKEITVPDTVETIYNDAFNGCFDIKVSYRGMVYSYSELSEIYTETEGQYFVMY